MALPMMPPRMMPNRTSSGPAACAVPKEATRAIEVRIRFMFIYYSRRYLLSQGLKGSAFEFDVVGLAELEDFLSSCPHIGHALDRTTRRLFGKDIDMVGLIGLIPNCGLEVDVVFH
jgi:hypothetical protein